MMFRKIYIAVGIMVMGGAAIYLTGWPAINDGRVVSAVQNASGSMGGSQDRKQISAQKNIEASGETNKDGALNKNEKSNKHTAKSDHFSYEPAQGWASPEIIEYEAELSKIAARYRNPSASAKEAAPANKIKNTAVSRSELPAPRANIVYTEFTIPSSRGENVKIAVPESANKMPDVLVNVPDLPGSSSNKFTGETRFSR